jgi:hypothetical protein
MLRRSSIGPGEDLQRDAELAPQRTVTRSRWSRIARHRVCQACAPHERPQWRTRVSDPNAHLPHIPVVAAITVPGRKRACVCATAPRPGCPPPQRTHELECHPRNCAARAFRNSLGESNRRSEQLSARPMAHRPGHNSHQVARCCWRAAWRGADRRGPHGNEGSSLTDRKPGRACNRRARALLRLAITLFRDERNHASVVDRSRRSVRIRASNR